jgi:hypothetical protein
MAQTKVKTETVALPEYGKEYGIRQIGDNLYHFVIEGETTVFVADPAAPAQPVNRFWGFNRYIQKVSDGRWRALYRHSHALACVLGLCVSLIDWSAVLPAV